jgi:radical SAM superfamily enzyme YgiQ (UPF0313 family)
VLGGYHPTAMPEEAKQHADSVVMGDSEYIWPILLEDFEKKQLKPNPYCISNSYKSNFIFDIFPYSRRNSNPVLTI